MEFLQFLAGKAFYWDERLKTITFQYGVQYIGELTCRHCPYLEAAYIPESVIFIGELSFTECPKLTIYAPEGSYAANYAKENGIPLVLEQSLKSDNLYELVSGVEYSIEELKSEVFELDGMSNQKISALLIGLIEDGRVEKVGRNYILM